MAYVKASEREQQIIAAAIAEFSDSGVPRTTLRAVASRAGIPLGTLHYVFPTKDQLLRSVILAVIDEISAALRAELSVARGVEDALRLGIGNFWTKLVSHEVGLQTMQYELMTYSLRSGSDGHLARLQYERYSAVVTEFCENAAQAAGERCAVGFDSLGRIALAQIDGLILQYVASPDLQRAQRDLTNAIDMLVLFADPQPVARPKPVRSQPA